MRNSKMLLHGVAAMLLLAIPNSVLSQEDATTSPSPNNQSNLAGYNMACNTTDDCQTNKSLLCLEHTCHCAFPQMFDLRLERCVIPLGKPCDSTDLQKGDAMCPEFGECFLDRCVCKTGYSMHTLTRCKSDLLEVPKERKPIVLWPRESPSGKEEETVCNTESCDESKGLSCQDGQCKCIDSKEIFVEEFGRCLNSTIQNSLKDALKLVSTSEDEIKSFVKLLEKFDEVDQHTGNSDHYNSPVHQLLGLLGGLAGRGRSSSTAPTTSSQVAPPNRYAYDGDLQHAAQETVTETTAPMSSTAAETDQVHEGGAEADDDGTKQTGGHLVDPVNEGHGSVETSGEGPPHYSTESGESIKKPEPNSGIHLDNFNYQGQPQEPAIVQRQAPPYLQGEGIPLEGIGTIPQNHYRLPINQGGFGGQGFGGLGQGYGGYGGLGGLGQGGFGQGLGGFGGLGGGHGLGLGGQGLSGLAGLGRGLLGFGRGQGGGPPPRGPPGGGGPPPPGGPPGGPGGPQQESLLKDLGEFIARSLKLMDRFLPLIHVINDTIKKEGIFGKKESLLPGGLRDRRFGENKESEDLKEGGIMQGVARFIAILMRLKNRLQGDVALKKLLS